MQKYFPNLIIVFYKSRNLNVVQKLQRHNDNKNYIYSLDFI